MAATTTVIVRNRTAAIPSNCPDAAILVVPERTVTRAVVE